jgi:N-dimethylarginine dimethylaminohydrolase
MRIGFRTVQGTTIRYAESSGPTEQSLPLTSPWPDSVYVRDGAAAKHASVVADWVAEGWRITNERAGR